MIKKLFFSDFKNKPFKTCLIIFVLFVFLVFSLFLFLVYKNINNFFFEQTGISKMLQNQNVVEVFIKGNDFAGIIGNDKIKGKDQIKSLSESEYVEKTYDFYNINILNYLSIDFLKRELKTDFLLYCVSDDYFNNYKSYDYVPFSISERLLDIYNLELSNRSIFPELDKKTLKDTTINLHFNSSSIFDLNSSSVSMKGKLLKLDNLVPIIGLTIPCTKADNILNNIDRGSKKFYKSIVYFKDKKYISNAKKEYDSLSFVTLNSRLNDLNTNLYALKLFFVSIFVFIILVLIGFMFFVIHSIVFDNKKIFDILRSHGSTRIKIFSIIYIKVLIFYLISFLFLLIVSVLSNVYLFELFENYLYDFYNVSLDLILININDLIYLFIIGFVIISFFVLIVSYKEYSKKFLN